MTFHEDDSRIRRGNAVEVMNAFRKLALNIVKTDTTKKASMKRKLKMAALDDDFRTELLLRGNLNALALTKQSATQQITYNQTLLQLIISLIIPID
ncbi:hypothetical protein [Flocculibacter collagenilyticus]|uniref:hypothetical protein n=1 Tax=Flocculibacter collagenilyticus TaxID=2744479 RepID=UPI0018F755C7|nr:hypothetical protein [Flocculibacter collagenilyticus]